MTLTAQGCPGARPHKRAGANPVSNIARHPQRRVKTFDAAGTPERLAPRRNNSSDRLKRPLRIRRPECHSLSPNPPTCRSLASDASGSRKPSARKQFLTPPISFKTRAPCPDASVIRLPARAAILHSRMPWFKIVRSAWRIFSNFSGYPPPAAPAPPPSQHSPDTSSYDQNCRRHQGTRYQSLFSLPYSTRKTICLVSD